MLSIAGRVRVTTAAATVVGRERLHREVFVTNGGAQQRWDVRSSSSNNSSSHRGEGGLPSERERDVVDVVIAGGGVIGLALAAHLCVTPMVLPRLSQDGRCEGVETRVPTVVVAEAAAKVGTGSSSRSSEVIHAGLYYPTGTLKAKLCVPGRDLLYEYCQKKNVGHSRCGKIVVATSQAQVPKLKAILEQGYRNGVKDLEWLGDEGAVRAREPAVRAVAGIWSPSSGIVDSAGLMSALVGDIHDGGGMVATGAPVLRAVREGDGLLVSVGGSEPIDLLCSTLVNSCGLDASALARKLIDPKLVPAPLYCKGNYFSVSGRGQLKHLIYPLPDAYSLGLHVTLDLGGGVRLGPDIEWVSQPDYTVDPKRAESFYKSVREFWPGLPDDSLTPSYAGIRPKVEGTTDWLIQECRKAPFSFPGLINLLGMESPGLTSSLALARHLRSVLQEDLRERFSLND